MTEEKQEAKPVKICPVMSSDHPGQMDSAHLAYINCVREQCAWWDVHVLETDKGRCSQGPMGRYW